MCVCMSGFVLVYVLLCVSVCVRMKVFLPATIFFTTLQYNTIQDNTA